MRDRRAERLPAKTYGDTAEGFGSRAMNMLATIPFGFPEFGEGTAVVPNVKRGFMFDPTPPEGTDLETEGAKREAELLADDFQKNKAIGEQYLLALKAFSHPVSTARSEAGFGQPMGDLVISKRLLSKNESTRQQLAERLRQAFREGLLTKFDEDDDNITVDAKEYLRERDRLAKEAEPYLMSYDIQQRRRDMLDKYVQDRLETEKGASSREDT